MSNDKKSAKTNTEPQIEAKAIEKPLSIDDIFVNDPKGYAAKFQPPSRKLIINYLNSRPMAQVEVFFTNMFDIPDQDPFYTIEWIKKLFDYLKNVCPRGEAKDVILGLAQGTILYKTSLKEGVKQDTGKSADKKEQTDADKK